MPAVIESDYSVYISVHFSVICSERRQQVKDNLFKWEKRYIEL